MNNLIHFKDVSWVRERKSILSNINWQVEKGQHWAVLGLNGSGKTALLNMVNGYIWPTTGEVSVLSHEFGKVNLRDLRKSIGWVSSSLAARINGRQRIEQIVISGKYASTGVYDDPLDSDFEKANQLLKLMGCTHLKNRRYETCSSGEKQKLLIARGLMASPELLILDEPTNGLDFVAREELMQLIDSLMKIEDGPTIILITHHIEEILPSISHVLMLEKGSILEQGKRKKMLTSSKLSALFENNISVSWQNNRAWMTLLEQF